MKNLYIISGCNGAGKTTASYTILPEILDCKEFVNADEIAKGLSPFQPELANIQAGRLMLERINYLLNKNLDFALETTLSSKIFTNLIQKAQAKNYHVTLLFFWLNSQELALKRVQTRVKEGGHNIPEKIIFRRYFRGLNNFFNLYNSIVDEWMFFDNSENIYELIAQYKKNELRILNISNWIEINELIDEE